MVGEQIPFNNNCWKEVKLWSIYEQPHAGQLAGVVCERVGGDDPGCLVSCIYNAGCDCNIVRSQCCNHKKMIFIRLIKTY